MIRAGHHPFGKPPNSAQRIADADQIAVPFVPFQAQPKFAQVPFVTFEDSEEMGAREQKHAGEVIAFVVASRRGDDFIEARRRKRR
jgi:hypothetical protein